jgi:multicomponent Na+:H+ antiporter subunit F
MTAIASFAASGLALLTALFMVRLFIGPTLHDRLLAAQCVAVNACLLIAALATAAKRPDWVDAAIAMALGAFVVLAAGCKFLRYRSFQTALSPAPREGAAP